MEGDRLSAPATIIDLLAALPEEELTLMRRENLRRLEEARTELARLRVEEKQFEEAAEIAEMLRGEKRGRK